MDLNEISIFIKVVQSGSFTKAATQLNIPISTVSSRVSSLERRLGITLLQRTTRQLKLTQAGKLYFDQSLKGLEEIHKAESEILSNQLEPHGDLKITSPHFLGNSLLPPIIATCLKKYPKINIELILTDRSVDLINEGIDLAIRAGNLKDSSLIAKKLGVVKFSPYAHPSYLKKNKEPSHPKDLSQHTCIQFSPLTRKEWIFSNDKHRIQVKLTDKIVVDDLAISKSLALAGLGIALLPTYLCEKEVLNDKLIALLPDWESINKPLHFVYPQQKFSSAKLKAFLDIATTAIQKQLKV